MTAEIINFPRRLAKSPVRAEIERQIEIIRALPEFPSQASEDEQWEFIVKLLLMANGGKSLREILAEPDDA